MTRFAFIIGVEKYSQFSPTKFSHADCELIYTTLTKKCDYSEQHSIIFKLSPDKDKTPLEILSKICNLVSKSEFGDSILFYFAGHGHYHEGKTYLILPNTVPGAYESSALSLDDISKELRTQERSCFRIFDACHSGIDVRDDNAQPNSQDFLRSVNHEASGWVTLAACAEDQFSISDPNIGHGIFTYYLCSEISSLDADEPIYPELLKVKVTDKVFEHSKNLGYSQSPTINASISGNISLAIRRANLQSDSKEPVDKEGGTDLNLRIAKLSDIKDVLTNELLENFLNELVAECLNAFKNCNSLNFDISPGPQIAADDIPEQMHPSIVKLSRSSGIQSRHSLIRYEKEYDDGYDPLMSAFSYLSPRKKIVIHHVSQPKDMPPSACIIDLTGDNRCVPNIKVLIYLIPLQITGCILISVFNCGWKQNDNYLEHVKNFYQIIKPDDSLDRIKEIGPFAAEGAMGKVIKIVEKRVELLERELEE